MNKLLQFFHAVLMRQGEIDSLQNEVSSLQRSVVALNTVVSQLIDESGGSGWTETIQNAISNLDNRIDALASATMVHQAELEKIAEDKEAIEILTRKTYFKN
jgi:prefoldin subunit 5